METISGSVSFLGPLSFSSFAAGSFTPLPRWSMGVTTMKMISSTRHTSTSGVTLMSDLMPPDLPPADIPMVASVSVFGRVGARALLVGARHLLGDHVQELVGGLGDVHRASVHPTL